MVRDESHGPMLCEQGNQGKRQRQAWCEGCASPVLHSFLQKFDMVRPCRRPRIRYCQSQRTDGRYGGNCVQFPALRGSEEPVLWRTGSDSGWADTFFELDMVMPLYSNNRSKETPVVMNVVVLMWKLCTVSPQVVLIISTVDTTSLRWLWALKESGSQASPRGGAESDFEATLSSLCLLQDLSYLWCLPRGCKDWSDADECWLILMKLDAGDVSCYSHCGDCCGPHHCRTLHWSCLREQDHCSS